jgi:hypothetical protein
MIKLGKRGIRLSVTPIIEDLFWSSFTVEDSLKAHVSASEIILDMSVTSSDAREGNQDGQTYSSIFVSCALIIESSLSVKCAMSTTEHPGTLDMARTCK